MAVDFARTIRAYYVVCQDDGPVRDGRVPYVLHIEPAPDDPGEAAEQFAALSHECREEQGPVHVTAYHAASAGAADRQARSRRERPSETSRFRPATTNPDTPHHPTSGRTPSGDDSAPG